MLKTLRRSKEGRARDPKVRGKAQRRVAKNIKKRKRVAQTKMPSKLTPLWIGREEAESKRRRWISTRGLLRNSPLWSTT
jgi:hypothetical protein